MHIQNNTVTVAAARIYNWGGGGGGGGGGGARYITRCRRQCKDVRSADQSARRAGKKNRLHLSAIRMGSRGTFMLLHCKFQMYEDCRSRGRHEPCAAAPAVINATQIPINYGTRANIWYLN